MKKIKIFILSISLLACGALLFSTEVSAKIKSNNKQIQTQTCTDKDGNTTGVGNTCIDSQEHNCSGNPCGS